MYKKSRFVIEQRLEDEHKILLFSTKTAKFVEISDVDYLNIVKENYKDCEKVKCLFEAGILVEMENDEFTELSQMRKSAIDMFNSKGTCTYLITPTMDCNARCFYCFEHGSQRDAMTLETALNTANFIIKQQKHHSGPISIHWFGGEPLMETEIIDAIAEKLNQAGVEFESRITTNGYLLTPELVKKSIENWHTVMMQITFDDIGEKYNHIKRFVQPCEDPFAHVLANIEQAIEIGMKIRIRINYDPRDVARVPKMMEYFRNYFNNKLNKIVVHPIDADNVPSLADYHVNDGEHPFFQVIDICEQNEELSQPEKNKHKTMTPITRKFFPQCNIRELYRSQSAVSDILCKYYLQPIPIFCAGISNATLAIDSHGDIFTCINFLGQGKEYTTGNVVSGIEHNEFYNLLQSENIEHKACYRCSLLPVCQGGCKFKRRRYKGSQACIPIKGIVKDAVYRAWLEIKSEVPEYIIRLD